MKYENGVILEKSYGILYDNNNKEIYIGLLILWKPKEGKKFIFYEDNGDIKYEGDFSNYKYNGKDIIFIKDIKLYEEIFKNDKYYNGILYNEIEYKKYEGEFKDNFPKEVNDIKLNDISEYLFYEGNILNYKYDGIGKLNIKEKNIIYKGEFKSGLYEGKGIYIIIILKNMMGNLKMINIILENMKLMLKIIFIYIIKKILKIIKYLEKE